MIKERSNHTKVMHVFTKKDKLTLAAMRRQEEVIQEAIVLDIIIEFSFVSSLSGEGLKELKLNLI